MALDADIERLIRVPLFAAMNHEALRLLAFAAEPCRFSAGDILFSVGDPGDSAFLIVSGSAVVLGARRAASDPARRVVLGPGTLLGENALIAATERTTTAQAETDIETIKISRSLLSRVLQEYPQNARDIRKRWASKLQRRLRRVTGSDQP